jgi:F420-dependent oxidoreductase-like protein
VRFGLDVSQHQLTWPELLDRVRFAEAAGFDGAWLFDHFTALYGDPTGPCLEAWTLLAALGASTERIRLGTLVTGVTHRHPSMLATELVTADHVSGGRVELAIGAAWNEHEHRMLGFPFPPGGERVAMLEEAVVAMRLLMTTDGASFNGAHYRLTEASYHPRPVQRPHPPIWIGGGGTKLLGVAARQADVWHGFGSIEAVRERSATLDRLAEEAGRDPSAIRRASSLSISEDWDEVATNARALHAAGFDYLVVDWPGEGEARVEHFVRNLLPEFTSPDEPAAPRKMTE